MKKTIDLGKGNVGKLLISLALPAIIAQIVNILYNIVDRIFIGRVPDGQMAMAGVGVAFPIIIIISAFSALVGVGGAPLATIKMGEKDNDGAEKILSNSFVVLLIMSVILTIVFFVFKTPILEAFGGSAATMPYALEYLSIYLIGTIFVQIVFGLNPFINTQGFAKIGMYTILIGAVTNIILDPILIFGFNMGVKGAALATVISQMVSAIWVLKFFFGKTSVLRIRKKYLMPDRKVILGIMALGIAPFIMQSTESLVIIIMNNKLLQYGGDLSVSSMTIMSSLMQMATLPIIGLAQGAQPIMSYNFGAGKMDRVKKTFKLLLISSLAFTIIMWGLITIMPEFFVSIFNNDPALMERTTWSMGIFFAGLGVFGAQMACQQTFLALGQAKKSLILALLRKIILLIPLVFILPNFFNDKLMATLLAEPVADITAAIITVSCFVYFYKNTLSKIQKENSDEADKKEINNEQIV